MPKRCAAAGCSNTYKDNISLFLFPKDDDLRSKWIKQVKRTRAEWSGPSDHSVLCSDHFDGSCFEPDTEIASQMGLKKRVRLKVDAVPTIFVRHSHSCSQSEPGPNTSRKRTSSHLSSSDSAATKRKAFEKRERQRVSACSYWYKVSIIYSNNSSLVIYLALTGVSGRVLVCTF